LPRGSLTRAMGGAQHLSGLALLLEAIGNGRSHSDLLSER
jgi:hypothetical protein